MWHTNRLQWIQLLCKPIEDSLELAYKAVTEGRWFHTSNINMKVQFDFIRTKSPRNRRLMLKNLYR